VRISLLQTYSYSSFPFNFLKQLHVKPIGTATRIGYVLLRVRTDDGSFLDGDGEEEAGNEPKSKDALKACFQSHPKVRHRFKGLSKQWKHLSPGFILVYFWIICIVGATKIRNKDFLYSATHHTNNPIVQNECTQ
jgi:hypothetical protein